jgi:hypothetical protein
MRLLVTIPARCRPEHPLRRRNLVACLKQLQAARSRLPPAVTVEVVIAEHDARPRLRALAREYGADHVLVPGAGLFAKARCCNEGIGERTPDLICLLDGDCWVTPSWLVQCLALIAEWQRVGEWRGAMLPYDRFRFLAPGPSAVVAAGGEPDKSMRHEACSSVGGAVWITLELYWRIGGWDEAYEGWCPDDRDFAFRLEQAMGAPILRGALPLPLPLGVALPVEEREGVLQALGLAVGLRLPEGLREALGLLQVRAQSRPGRGDLPGLRRPGFAKPCRANVR